MKTSKFIKILAQVALISSSLLIRRDEIEFLYYFCLSIQHIFQQARYFPHRKMAISIYYLQGLHQISRLLSENHHDRRLPVMSDTCQYAFLQFGCQVIHMSQQIDGFLQMGMSHNFDRQKLENYRCKTIDPDAFQKWSKDYMYKTSYAHFHSRDSAQPKTGAIPGYQGYILSIKAENIHARGFSAMAKQSFQNDRLGKNEFGLSSTGFNLNREALVDRSKAASSSKYGKSEIQRAHPGWNAPWGSTTHDTFKNPAEQVNPTYRPTEKWLQTQKASTKTSGFATNNACQDGHGWRPDPVLKGDTNRTEYRDRFNADHPFHRDPNVSIPAKLKKTQLNYRFN